LLRYGERGTMCGVCAYMSYVLEWRNKEKIHTKATA